MFAVPTSASRFLAGLFGGVCIAASGCATQDSSDPEKPLDMRQSEIGNWKESVSGSKGGYIGELKFTSEGTLPI